MKNRGSDVVSASEIASWAWRPESWRLSSLGREPSNREAMASGEHCHADQAAFEEPSRSAISVGWRLVVSGVVLALIVAIFLAARGWMNGMLLAALLPATLGVLVLAIASRGRSSRGFGAGETVALDDVTLFSETHGLAGRPDRNVREGEWLIPEEWKPSKRVSDGHRLQLGTYILLIEENYGVIPPHGVVVLGDGSRVQVRNTDELR